MKQGQERILFGKEKEKAGQLGLRVRWYQRKLLAYCGVATIITSIISILLVGNASRQAWFRNLLLERIGTGDVFELRPKNIHNDGAMENEAVDILYELENYWKFEQRRCDEITDPMYQLICYRLILRPHMLAFISKSSEAPLFSEDDHADKTGALGKKLIIFRKAMRIPEPIPSMKRCNQLNLINDIGECIFYATYRTIVNLQSDPRRKIHSMRLICDEIEDLNWKSECYFHLADEIVLQGLFEQYSEAVVESCIQSIQFKDFGCFSHTIINVSLGQALVLCNTMLHNDTQVFKECMIEQCYSGYGRMLSTTHVFEDTQSQADQMKGLLQVVRYCKQLNHETAVRACIQGCFWRLNEFENQGKRRRLFHQACNTMNGNKKDTCISMFGLIEGQANRELSLKLQPLPRSWQPTFCYQFGIGLLLSSKFKLMDAITTCSHAGICEFECNYGLINQLDMFKTVKHTDTLGMCDLFPGEYQQKCYASVALSEYQHAGSKNGNSPPRRGAASRSGPRMPGYRGLPSRFGQPERVSAEAQPTAESVVQGGGEEQPQRLTGRAG